MRAVYKHISFLLQNQINKLCSTDLPEGRGWQPTAHRPNLGCKEGCSPGGLTQFGEAQSCIKLVLTPQCPPLQPALPPSLVPALTLTAEGPGICSESLSSLKGGNLGPEVGSQVICSGPGQQNVTDPWIRAKIPMRKRNQATRTRVYSIKSVLLPLLSRS